jgi:hypothetical protein
MPWKHVGLALMALLTLAAGAAMVAVADPETGKTLEVTLGKAIDRNWDEVKADKYAYGPKQDYDADKKEIHIYLPYGNDGSYFEVSGVNFTDPGSESGCPLARTPDGNTSLKLVYKLHFDKPVKSFRMSVGWTELGLAEGAVGGVEYSTDGQKWSTVNEVSKGGIVEPLVKDDKSFDLPKGARDLYIRFYSRDKANPDSGSGPSRWMKFRMAGDPSWGDASSTFFQVQVQVWATAAE